MQGPPGRSVLQPTTQHVMLINRMPGENRAIPNGEDLLGVIGTQLRGLGHSTPNLGSANDSIIEDFGALGIGQPGHAYRKTLIISPHGGCQLPGGMSFLGCACATFSVAVDSAGGGCP